MLVRKDTYLVECDLGSPVTFRGEKGWVISGFDFIVVGQPRKICIARAGETETVTADQIGLEWTEPTP